jgi:hypothetical protein
MLFFRGANKDVVDGNIELFRDSFYCLCSEFTLSNNQVLLAVWENALKELE